MAIDIQRLFYDHRINFITSGTQVTRGWVNTQCPFCGDTKHHLGYSERLDLFSCWKCGVKSVKWTLHKLLNKPFDQIDKIILEYFIAGSKVAQRENRAKDVVLPENFGCLKKAHKAYLKSRNFNPDELRRKWGLVAADDWEWRNMILVPIYFKGRLVSYHSRSILEETSVKAKPCPEDKEVMRHKDILYGFDNVVGNTIIVSEGQTDVWRWGDNATGLFGIKYTESQVNLLSCFKNIFIIFDSGPEERIAQKQACRLADKLSIFKNNVWVIDDLGCDPADLSQRKANKIKKRLFKIASES